MAMMIGATFLVVVGLGWLIARLTRPRKLNRVSDLWLDQHKYDRRQQRPE